MVNLSISQNLNEIVKPMQRGQITIPINIRKKLKITPQTWLWVKLVNNEKILIEPVEKESLSVSMAEYLLSSLSDSQIYWDEEDMEVLKKVKKRSSERLKKLI